MRLRTDLLVCALFLIAVVGGCVGAESAAPKGTSGASTGAAPPTVTSDTGSIHGVVTDDQMQPVVGAQVAVLEAAFETLTDAAGTFTFNNLTPGPYRLAVQKLGYEAGGKAVTIAAGEVAQVSFILYPVTVLEARHETEILQGYYNMGVSAAGWTVRPGYLLPTGTERSIIDTNVTDGANLKTVVDTMVWTQNTALSATKFWLDVKLDGTTKNQTVARSPAVVRIDDDEKDGDFINAKKKGSKWNHWTWVISVIDTNEPTTLVSVVVDQKFTLYVSSFWVQPAPADFVFKEG